MGLELCLDKYRTLLERIDSWFNSSIRSFPEHISCSGGCSGCCRGLFDITILDAAMLRQGFAGLPMEAKKSVLTKAEHRLEKLQLAWPDLSPPFMLNYRPEEEWEELMPDSDETPCVLLDEEGRCMVYDHRPMTCRLHGVPLIDTSGEIMHDEWCTENFTSVDPLALRGLDADFDDMFRAEVAIGREFTNLLLGETVYEMDTFIPLALLVDFEKFPWRKWWLACRDEYVTLKA